MRSAALPATAAASPWRRMLARGARSLLLGVAIAAALTLVLGRPFGNALAYSLPITAACWFLIDGGRLLALRWSAPAGPGSQWPGWPWMLAVIVLGSALGYLLGNAAGNLLTGSRAATLPFELPLAGLLLLVLLPAVGTTYYYYSRERLAAEQRQRERAERDAAQTQLRLLQAQLEPHMLFNTLANLRVLITLDPPRAQAMLDRLIAFLRATLEASRSGRHALSTEFERVGDYLALMQVRLGERLQVRLELPPALAAAPVPPLLLQPLVENAIKHGIEPCIDGGRIELSAAQDGRMLVLRVRDTGAGLAASPAAGGTQFGLRQVGERLATLFGERATLVLQAAEGGGTLATVRLPLEA